MPVPLDQARTAIDDLDVPEINNLFAQAHARYVLYELNERPENFPAFDPVLDDKATFTAYALLAVGCSLAEQRDRSQSIIPLERAASVLQHIHGPRARSSRESGFHTLVSSMAFYAAGQYSRAFVAVRGMEEQTAAARTIGSFLRKDTKSLIQQLNQILLRDTPAFEDQLGLDEWAITVVIARAIALALEFIYTGTRSVIEAADGQLQDAATIATAEGHSAWWWIIRLLRLMLADLLDASLWTVLPPYLGPGSADIDLYIRLLAFADRPVVELWTSQRSALPIALNPNSRGGVLNLRTSAGKTRVAELAILQTLSADPMARVIYLAPFRSLALEVEHTLGTTLTWMGYTVSHLYGGSRISSIDTELAEESTITIATPEKARALLRAAPEIFLNVRLIIVDEGHLIGPSERLIRNEIFVDHLRCLARATGARILVLSAVLPNAQELAEWVTGDKTAVANSTWKPSAERFGLLRWNGSRVRLEWRGGVESLNPSFVEARKLDFGRREKLFPNDKNEAVAAAAVRLSSIGPVMIFTGRAVSVPTLARAVLLAFGKEPIIHPWSAHEWGVFEAVCKEELEPDAIELRAARVGVICHSNRLTPQVRLALEHLMRVTAPRIIVATTTLAQGVNVGISSVIIATPYIGQETIDKRDFWNICGRAGRAFVDGEGKILYAIDDTREQWQIDIDEQLAREYLDSAVAERVESGLLLSIRLLRDISQKAGVSFQILLELAANNDFSILKDGAARCERICDLLDDELLALHEDQLVNPTLEDPSVWVERVFRDSLAVIQSRADGARSEADDVLAFLHARAQSTLRDIDSPAIRKSLVSSGLPLRVAVQTQRDLGVFRAIADSCIKGAYSLSILVNCLREIENWAKHHAGSVAEKMPEPSRLDAVREGWLGGIGLRDLSTIESEMKTIARDLYGYQLPWIIHAASQQLLHLKESERANTLARIALLVELGVPSETAARIFLAGVRSRVAATELASLGLALGTGITEIRRRLGDHEFTTGLRDLISTDTATWLILLAAESTRGSETISEFPAFTLSVADSVDVLHTRKLADRIFLCTVDGSKRIQVYSSISHPFDKVADDPRICFIRSGKAWIPAMRDPRLRRGKIN